MITTSKTCVTESGKKKCTTTTLIKGLGVSGASVKAVAVKGGKLVITLKKAAASVTVSLGGPVLTETSSLQSAVKKHKVKSVTVALKVTDVKHTTTSVPLKLTVLEDGASAAHPSRGTALVQVVSRAGAIPSGPPAAGRSSRGRHSVHCRFVAPGAPTDLLLLRELPDPDQQ